MMHFPDHLKGFRDTPDKHFAIVYTSALLALYSRTKLQESSYLLVSFSINNQKKIFKGIQFLAVNVEILKSMKGASCLCQL